MRLSVGGKMSLVGTVAAMSAVAALALPSSAVAAETSTPPRIGFRAEVRINVPQNLVFNLVGDYKKDQKWRIGVLDMDVPSPLKLGDTVTETLQFVNGYELVTPGILIERVVPSSSVLETGADNPHYLKIDRKVKFVAPAVTEFSDTLTVDASLLDEVFPGVPQSDVIAGYTQQMEAELQTAKELLEHRYN